MMTILRNALLVAFERVCALGTTHAAARELKLTQTGVTQRIKSLERELGLTLFLRSRRGMQVTEEGRALLQLCRAGRELEGQFLSQVSGSGRRDVSLTLAGPTSALSTRVATAVVPVYQRNPFLRLHLLCDDHSDLIASLRRGEADLAVVAPALVPLEMDSKLLKPDRYLLVACPKWKGRRLQDIVEQERVIDFYESDRTTARYLTEFSLGRPARERIFVNENEALVRLFAAGVGFGTLTESVARPHLESGSLIALNKGQALEDALALAWFPRPRKMAYFEDLVRAVR
jgi:LysR family transcriptional regulator (chromosome initiation inhibitor)